MWQCSDGTKSEGRFCVCICAAPFWTEPILQGMNVRCHVCQTRALRTKSSKDFLSPPDKPALQYLVQYSSTIAVHCTTLYNCTHFAENQHDPRVEHRPINKNRNFNSYCWYRSQSITIHQLLNNTTTTGHTPQSLSNQQNHCDLTLEDHFLIPIVWDAAPNSAPLPFWTSLRKCVVVDVAFLYPFSCACPGCCNDHAISVKDIPV